MGYNVFADMGFENPEMELLKSEIASSLRHMMTEKQMTDTTAAYLWDIPAAEVPDLLKGHWENYSVEDLMRFADALNRNVRIIIDGQIATP